MPAVEAAFAVIIAGHLTILTVAMAYLAFVISERQDLELVSRAVESTDAAPIESDAPA